MAMAFKDTNEINKDFDDNYNKFVDVSEKFKQDVHQNIGRLISLQIRNVENAVMNVTLFAEAVKEDNSEKVIAERNKSKLYLNFLNQTINENK
jgi:hypothetical protein